MTPLVPAQDVEIELLHALVNMELKNLWNLQELHPRYFLK